jgi:hypothetical protein
MALRLASDEAVTVPEGWVAIDHVGAGHVDIEFTRVRNDHISQQPINTNQERPAPTKTQTWKVGTGSGVNDGLDRSYSLSLYTVASQIKFRFAGSGGEQVEVTNDSWGLRYEWYAPAALGGERIATTWFRYNIAIDPQYGWPYLGRWAVYVLPEDQSPQRPFIDFALRAHFLESTNPNSIVGEGDLPELDLDVPVNAGEILMVHFESMTGGRLNDYGFEYQYLGPAFLTGNWISPMVYESRKVDEDSGVIYWSDFAT